VFLCLVQFELSEGSSKLSRVFAGRRFLLASTGAATLRFSTAAKSGPGLPTSEHPIWSGIRLNCIYRVQQRALLTRLLLWLPPAIPFAGPPRLPARRPTAWDLVPLFRCHWRDQTRIGTKLAQPAAQRGTMLRSSVCCCFLRVVVGKRGEYTRARNQGTNVVIDPRS